MAGESPAQPTRRKPRRTWPQRLTITGAFLCAIACFGAAGVLYAGQRVDRRPQHRADDHQPRDQHDRDDRAPDLDGGDGGDGDSAATTTPPPRSPPAEPGAKNFLITGADNNSCVDPDSPYAPAFGDRSNIGERSDTIMMWRINPDTSQVAVLSFPRDLWVTIDGRSSQQRINVAYERDNPQKLINTIYQNFGIVTDHFIQVDFCAFQKLVDAVDGVTVPFATPVRDPNTGLNVPEAGCYTFDGDHALGYVRSRKMQSYTDEDGWVTDGTSDLGRISRQQDFLRRTVDRLLEKGAFDPEVAGALIETVSEYIVTDPSLTPRKMLEFAGVMSKVDPTAITTYQIEAREHDDPGQRRARCRRSRARTCKRSSPSSRARRRSPTPPTRSSPPPCRSTFRPPPRPPRRRPRRGPAPRPRRPRRLDPRATTLAPAPTTTLPAVVAEENIIGVAPDPNAVCEYARSASVSSRSGNRPHRSHIRIDSSSADEV